MELSVVISIVAALMSIVSAAAAVAQLLTTPAENRELLHRLVARMSNRAKSRPSVTPYSTRDPFLRKLAHRWLTLAVFITTAGVATAINLLIGLPPIPKYAPLLIFIHDQKIAVAVGLVMFVITVLALLMSRHGGSPQTKVATVATPRASRGLVPPATGTSVA